MKAIWKGKDNELELRTGKTYEILSVECDGNMYNVIDETGEDYLYPAEDFEIIKETEVITEAETELIDLLRNIEDDINFVMAASLIARTEKKTEVLIDFIEEYTEADAEDVICFLVPGKADDE